MDDAHRREANEGRMRDLFTRYHEMVNRDIDELGPYSPDDAVLELPRLGIDTRQLEHYPRPER